MKMLVCVFTRVSEKAKPGQSNLDPEWVLLSETEPVQGLTLLLHTVTQG